MAVLYPQVIVDHPFFFLVRNRRTGENIAVFSEFFTAHPQAVKGELHVLTNGPGLYYEFSLVCFKIPNIERLAFSMSSYLCPTKTPKSDIILQNVHRKEKLTIFVVRTKCYCPDCPYSLHSLCLAAVRPVKYIPVPNHLHSGLYSWGSFWYSLQVLCGRWGMRAALTSRRGKD